MTNIEFFEAYRNGQRHFKGTEFGEGEDLSATDLSNIFFENCFLFVDLRGCNLSNARFLSCNAKEIDLRNSNFTNAFMTNCLVESALFEGAAVEGFKFVDNYYHGLTIGQKEFENSVYKEAPQIQKEELTHDAFIATMGDKMIDVTDTAGPVVDIWPYAQQLADEGIIDKYVIENHLVEIVYADRSNKYHHILLPTDTLNKFIALVINVPEKKLRASGV